MTIAMMIEGGLCGLGLKPPRRTRRAWLGVRLCLAALAPLAALAALALGSSGARADGGWIAGRPGAPEASARSAGYALDGVFTGLWFSCEATKPGTLRLVVARDGWRFDDALDQTVVASVDGTAYLFTLMPEPRPGRPGDQLARTIPLAGLKPLIAALAKGKRAEVSTTQGRYGLPLGGSGRALAALLAGCG